MKPVTRIYSEEGYWTGIKKPDGSVIPTPFHSHPCVAWDSELSPEEYRERKGAGRDLKVVVGEVVWDGACGLPLTCAYPTQLPKMPRGGVPAIYMKRMFGDTNETIAARAARNY